VMWEIGKAGTGTAEVADGLAQHVAEPAPLVVGRGNNVKPFPISYRRAVTAERVRNARLAGPVREANAFRAFSDLGCRAFQARFLRLTHGYEPWESLKLCRFPKRCKGCASDRLRGRPHDNSRSQVDVIAPSQLPWAISISCSRRSERALRVLTELTSKRSWIISSPTESERARQRSSVAGLISIAGLCPSHGPPSPSSYCCCREFFFLTALLATIGFPAK
jgi:hypothetical protein